jgi:hypothetical protein
MLLYHTNPDQRLKKGTSQRCFDQIGASESSTVKILPERTITENSFFLSFFEFLDCCQVLDLIVLFHLI